MIVHVKAKANSSKKKVENFGGNNYLIYLTEPPENNRANIELINYMSKYFGIPVGRIKIKRGANSSDKILELM